MKLIFALAVFVGLISPTIAGCDEAVYPDHDAASTPVAAPVFYQMVEGRNGQAVAVPGPGTSFTNFGDCWTAVLNKPNRIDYYCLRYESVPRIRYIFPN